MSLHELYLVKSCLPSKDIAKELLIQNITLGISGLD
jgi:hypothetical protein